MKTNFVINAAGKFRFNCAFCIAILVISLSILVTGCNKEEKAESQKQATTSSEVTERTDIKKPRIESTPVVKQPQRVDKSQSTSEKPLPTGNLPGMIDLGADKCVPCKTMAPILEELREEYKGKVDVVFIDVWKNPAPGREAKIRVIPTQIFYDASGKELFRHEGFFSKEDILAKWKELGFQNE